MHFSTTIVAIATLASTTLAVPPPPQGVHVFTVEGKGGKLPQKDFKPKLTAAHNKLFLNEPHPKADCDGHAEIAFFNFDQKTGGLFLYNNGQDPSREKQQVYVSPADDDSWNVGYTQSPPHRFPKGWTLDGWKVDTKGNLVWRGKNLMACPNQADDSWSIWLSKNGNPGCTVFEAHTTKVEYPNSCEYSTQK